jgi:hypothetical protein
LAVLGLVFIRCAGGCDLQAAVFCRPVESLLRPTRGRVWRALRLVLAIALALSALSSARAQSMEPRAYANAPTGLNFLIAGYGYQWGDVLVDPSLPIKDANAEAHTVAVNYVRVLDVLGQSGKVALVAPYAQLSASGEIVGQSRKVERFGLGDIALRLSLNLYGAPALSLEQFRDYRQDTIVGVTLLATAPTGQYNPQKLINIGTNRWSFRPEVGISKALGRWTLEAAASVTFFTENDQFLGANVREQEPLYGVQAHAIYTFGPSLWAALDGTYYGGGRTLVNGEPGNDLQENSRWGATLAQALGRHHSIKLYFNSGLTARSGTNFNTVGVAWQYRWGAGL